MRKIALVLYYLACVGHGRRVQTSSEENSPSADRQSLGMKLSSHVLADGESADPFRALAKLLLAQSPAAAYNMAAFVPRWQLPMVNTGRSPTAAAAVADVRRLATDGRARRCGAPCLLTATRKILKCGLCRAVYEVENEALFEEGRWVRCSLCGNEWMQTIAGMQELPENADMISYPDEMKARVEAGLPVNGFRCFVGNLEWKTTEAELRDLFMQYGVTDVKLMREDDGKSKGFGFVSLEGWIDGKRAIEELNDKKVGERNIVVTEAQMRPQGDGRGRGAGRGAPAGRGVPAGDNEQEAPAGRGLPAAVPVDDVAVGRGRGEPAPDSILGRGRGEPAADSALGRGRGEPAPDSLLGRGRGEPAPDSLLARGKGEAANGDQWAHAGARSLSDIVVGEEVEGKITNVAGVGVFVDFGAVKDGMIPSSESSGRLENPKVGDVIRGLIVDKVDESRNRIGLKFA